MKVPWNTPIGNIISSFWSVCVSFALIVMLRPGASAETTPEWINALLVFGFFVGFGGFTIVMYQTLEHGVDLRWIARFCGLVLLLTAGGLGYWSVTVNNVIGWAIVAIIGVVTVVFSFAKSKLIQPHADL